MDRLTPSLDPADSTALRAPLRGFLRALWGSTSVLHFGAEGPAIVAATIQLPQAHPGVDEAGAWRWYRAATAHAAAHLTYSPAVFDGRGLGPIPRALVGLLEDARVEALASRELPGLQRLWLPLHTATPLDGDGLETLLLRLARSLLDSGYDDPHPWVRKGRALFFLEPATRVLALRRPAELRQAASLLGHDLGQMRLQLNARSYRPGPDYRDDGRWMWPAPEAAEPAPMTPTPAIGSGAQDAPAHDPVIAAALEHYPEWDRLIARLRPAWCTVRSAPDEAPKEPRALAHAVESMAHPSVAALRQALQHADTRRGAAVEQGEHLDLDAVVRAGVARRLRAPIDPRVHRGPRRDRRGGHTLMLIDQSTSSSGPWERTGLDLLQAAGQVASLAGAAMQRLGIRVAIGSFCSNGRANVQWRLVKSFEDSFDGATAARLAGLRSRQSTRLGAAVRHATRQLPTAVGDGTRQLLIIGDGLPHDIDVHDPRYLVEDARHAVQQARRHGLRVSCAVLDAAGLATARRIFGAREVLLLESLDGLPGALRQLRL